MGTTYSGQQRSPGRLRAMLAVVLGVISLGWSVTPAAAAAVTMSKSAPATSLAGEALTYTLTASNPAGGQPEYNVTFRDELPLGVDYVAGSTSPAQFGEPTVITAPDGHQTLLWVNVVDLAVGATETLSFSVLPGAGPYPVASRVTNTASVYANTDPRTLPKFNPDGTYASGATQTATSAPVTTTLSAVRVTKTEPNPESELLRGVHTHPTVYTLTVTNTANAPTLGATVVDLLPAGLEFLGCGGVDNSAGPEYPGAPPLTATPPVGGTCLTPTSVSTVLDPAGQPAGVYTRVEWTLGPLAAGDSRVIQYAAGIPQRANTMTFPGGTPTSSGQIANLDNNTGASTREPAAETTLTNAASVSGTYTGPLATGGVATVTDSTVRRVSAEDISMQKSVAPTVFNTGGIATYTLTVRGSEYTTGSSIVLTDLLPDGLCPLSATTNYSPGALAECAPVAGADPTGASFASVTPGSDGRYTIVFTPVTLPQDGVVTITFKARMGSTYLSTSQPTVSGDSYLNTVSLTGTTTPRPGINSPDTGPVVVGDTSQARLTSDAPALSKRIQPDTGTRPYTCSTSAAAYRDDVPANDPSLAFDEGDRVCFLVRVEFSTTNNTKNPVVTDFLPAGMTYEAGSAQLTAANTATATLATTDPLSWTLGTVQSGTRFVPAGAVFEVRFAAIVGAPPAGPAPDLTANLAKFQFQNTSGVVNSLRDAVDLARMAAPPVTVAKSAARVLPAPVTPLPEGSRVSGGQTIEYTVAVTNSGAVATNNALDVVGPDVYDVLPVGVTCADVSAISDAGLCFNPAQAGYPGLRGGFAGRSVIRWDLPASVVLSPGTTRPLTYRVALPATESVSQPLVNTAAVSTYQTPTNTGQLADHAPATNIIAAVAVTDVPAAEDTHTLVVADAAVTKSVTTAITEPGNTETPTPAQATIGEDLDYTYSVVIPASTSVYAGYLADPLPTGIISRGTPTARYYPDAASTTSEALPTGVGLDPVVLGQLNFPTVWTNDTATDQRFEVSLPARVEDLGTNTHGRSRTNTATFSSKIGPTGARRQQTGQATVRVVLPSPSLTKTNNAPPPAFVSAGQVVTYTLRASNLRTRPPLHDAFTVDCLPAGIGYVTGSASRTPLSVSTGDGTNGCPVGATRLEWSLGDLDPNVTITITYRGTVTASAAGGQLYTNSATLSGSTLDDNKVNAADPDRAEERSLSVSATSTVAVTPSTVSFKQPERPAYTVGETARWTISVTIPPGANYYDTVLLDELPVGLVAGSLVTESVTCTRADASVCTVPDGGSALTPVAAGTSTLVGWAGGDFLADTQARTVRVVYTATIADVTSVVAGSQVTNTARVGWNLSDGTTPTSAGATPDQISAPIQASVTVREPQLSLGKSVNQTQPRPGDVFGYTLEVTNANGTNTSPAYSVTVTDDVPTGVVVDAATITRGGVLTGAGPDGGGTITWTIAGPIAPGATVALGYDARLSSPPVADTLTNTATIDSYRSRPGAGRTYPGPSATADVTARLPHVDTAKQVVGSDVGYLGEAMTFRVTLTNSGTAPAYGLDATDVLPEGWTFEEGSASVDVDGTPLTTGAEVPVVTGTPQTLTWTNIAPLQPNTSLVITYRAIPGVGLAPALVGHSVGHVNTVTAGAEDAAGAGGPAGGSYAGPPATATGYVDSADLVIDKAHTGTAVAGDPFSWTVSVTNAGPDPAIGPWTVTDTLPDGVSGGTASGTGWACSTVDQVITCTHPADQPLAVDAELPTITVDVVVDATVADGATLTNTAAGTGRTHDPNPANNNDDDPVVVTTSADLALVKSTSGTVTAGAVATWTIDLTNLGPSVSRGPITVTDTLPAGLTEVSADGTDWTCDPVAGDQLVCTYSGDVTTAAPQLTVSGRVASGQTGAVENSATITATTTDDPNPANDSDDTSDTPLRSADVDIAKTSLGTVTAGLPAVYEFVVANHGPSDATAVTITDTLPADLSYNSFSSVDGDWSCSAIGQDLTCTLTGALVADDTATVRVTVDVDPAHTGAVVNVAEVTSAVDDPNPDNNSDDDNSSVDVDADLAIDKSHLGPAVAGQTLDYLLQVTDNGPSVSPGPVTVTDTVPGGMTITSVDGGGQWSCDHDDTTLTCTATSLAVGPADPIIVTVSIAEDAGPATLRNTAAVAGPADSDPSNDSADDDTSVVDSAELSIAKSASSPVVVAGTDLSYQLEVTNAGPSTADSVVVSDTLPTGVVFVSASGDGWTCQTDQPTCRRDALAVGTSTITVSVTVDSSVPDGTVLTNLAEVQTTTPGDTTNGNSSSVDVPVITEVDLSVIKTHTDPAVAGTPLDYTVTVANAGPSDAVAPVSFTDTLPTGLTFESAAGGDWDCSAVGAEITCTSDTPIPAGSTGVAVVLSVAIADDVSGEVVNTVTLAPRQNDTDPVNDTADDPTLVSSVADLSVVKSHTGTATIGGTVPFTLQVHNAGPSQAVGVVVLDTLPTGLSYVADGSGGVGWTCQAVPDSVPQQVSCALADPVGPGDDAPELTIVVSVDPAAYPLATNEALVSSEADDPVTVNDSDSDPVDVEPLVNLTVEKSHTGDLAVGSQATYTLTVTNAGPTADPGEVTVTDTMPAGLRFVSANGDGWTCQAGPPVTCTRHGLEVGAGTVTLVVDVLPEAFPSVTNSVVVSTVSTETAIDDNSADDPATVTPNPVLGIDKALTSYTGAAAAYTITVTNSGTTPTVLPVVVTDPLPSMLAPLSAAGTGWTCSIAGQVVTCTLDAALAPAAAAVIRVNATVRPGTAPATTVRNTASVSSAVAGGSLTSDSAVLVTPAAPAQTPSGATTSPGRTSPLAYTGAETAHALLFALVNLAIGVALVRRRRRLADR